MYVLEDRHEQCQQYVLDIDKHAVQSQHYFSSIAQVLHDLGAKGVPGDMTLLLDERMFWRYRFDIIRTCRTPLTIGQVNDLLHEKLFLIQEVDGRTSAYVRHVLDHMRVDGEPTKHVLGKTGTVSFSLNVFMLRPSGASVVQLLGGKKVFAKNNIRILPKHMYVLKYVHTHVHKPDAIVVHIGDDMTQLLVMEKGWYKDVHYLNIGLNLLKSCYKEHGVEKHFYTSRDEVLENAFLKKLIDEAMSFFTDTLVQWLKEHVDNQTDIIVCGKVTENPSFLPVFQDSYSSYGRGYVLPLPNISVKGWEKSFSGEELLLGSVLRFA